MSSISDTKVIDDHILKPLLTEATSNQNEIELNISFGQISETNAWSQIEDAILTGKCILLIDQRPTAYIYDTPKLPKRGLEESLIESSLTGAHIGFTETG